MQSPYLRHISGQGEKWNDRGSRRSTRFLPNGYYPVTVPMAAAPFNFSEYLSVVSPEWNRVMGKGKALKWEAGIAAKGNPGVAGIVQQTEGAIGYIGSEYALTLNLKTAKLKNRTGRFVEATLETISAAANVDLPDDMRATITDSADPTRIPISLFTWILLYKDQQYGTAPRRRRWSCWTCSFTCLVHRGKRWRRRSTTHPSRSRDWRKITAFSRDCTTGVNPCLMVLLAPTMPVHVHLRGVRLIMTERADDGGNEL